MSGKWELGGDKGFSVKSLRNIMEEGVVGGGAATSWCQLIPPKVNVFLWRAKLDRIPTRLALNNRAIDLDSVLCPRCEGAVEDINHALVGCPEVKRLWERFGRWWNKDVGSIDSLSDLIHGDEEILRASKGRSWWVGAKWTFIYLVWTHRNKVVFNMDKSRASDNFIEWQRLVFEWLNRRCKKKTVGWIAWLAGSYG